MPLPLIMVTCSHAQVPLLLLSDKATENPYQLNVSIHNRLIDKNRLINHLTREERGHTFGSKNTMGFGSRIHDNNNPFACLGLR